MCIRDRSTNEGLNEATQAIESDSGISCSSLVRWQVTCALFDGLVTVSPMLEVVVNGKPTYIPIGSRLWFIIPHVTNSQQATLMRTLRVERWFQGRLVGIKIAPNSDELSQLLLFGGDRVSWSKTVEAKK